jgi:hypothetical protein
MYEKHADFKAIQDQDLLWRYQDLPRYLDLLLRKQLFFTRIDKFEDPFEGTDKRDAVLTPASKDHFSRDANKAFAGHPQKLPDQRIAVTVNTWHQNNDENYAMWNIYARGQHGLAIQTTFKNLQESFHNTPQPVNIGKVEYYDENCEKTPEEDSLLPFLRKRRIYEYEREVRCCYIVSQNENNEFYWEEQGSYNGVFINAALDTLIQRVYISPYSPRWFRDLVVRLNEQFGIHAEIVHSSVFSTENIL